MTRQDLPAGSASLVLADGVPLLHPDTQLFDAMLEGWRNQMLARNLAPATIRNQIGQVRAFAAHANDYPRQRSWSIADEWFADLRSVRHVSVATVRGYQVAIRGFCRFITGPAYGWASECERSFGIHPVQVITEVKSALHAADSEADPRERAFTRWTCRRWYSRRSTCVAASPTCRPRGGDQACAGRHDRPEAVHHGTNRFGRLGLPWSDDSDRAQRHCGENPGAPVGFVWLYERDSWSVSRFHGACPRECGC